ncbi:MAG: phage late control D family protein [Sphingomonadales bacterium]|nr:MAG: phage late control D family protein [Sphingomonadales bacterium]
MADPTHAIYSGRPRLEVAGQNQPRLEQGLSRLEIVETIQGLYRCEAEFINWGGGTRTPDFLYFDRTLLDFGKAFAVKLDTDVLFDGRIMALEGSFPAGVPPLITVLAEDRFQDLRMTRRTRTFEDVSDADAIRRIASDHGFTAEVSADGPTYKLLAQVNQSDLAFLRERARSIDAELWMDGAKLRVQSRASRRASAITLTLGRELQSFHATADLATQRTSVTANGWDVSAKTALQHEAGESVIRGELNGDTSGVSILKSAIGERKEAVAHTVPLNTSEAQSVAESYFKNCARRFVICRGTATTQAKLRVGALVDLKALGPLFSGKYYVVESRHLFDSTRGLRTEFTAERAGLGRAASPNG